MEKIQSAHWRVKGLHHGRRVVLSLIPLAFLHRHCVCAFRSGMDGFGVYSTSNGATVDPGLGFCFISCFSVRLSVLVPYVRGEWVSARRGLLCN